MGRFVTGLNLINEFRYSLSNMNRVLLSILTTLLFYTNSYIEIVAYLNKNNGEVRFDKQRKGQLFYSHCELLSYLL